MLSIKNIRFRVLILGIYILILPIDAALGNILGTISLINYIILVYILLRVNFLLQGEKIYNLKAIGKYIIYFIYFIISILVTFILAHYKISSYFMVTLIGSFIMFLGCVTDNYSVKEYEFIKKIISYSGILVICVTLLNYDQNMTGRFKLNFSRYMDPNFFACGFILISGIYTENIINNKNKLRNLMVLLGIIFIILLTGSRGGLLSNISVIILTLLLYNRGLIKKVMWIIFGVIIIFLGIYILSKFLPDFVIQRLEISSLIQDKGSGRADLWMNDIRIFLDSNLITQVFGNGFATHQSVLISNFGHGKVAHNIIFQSLIEGGIVGVFLTLRLFIHAFFKSYRFKRYSLCAVVIGLFISGMTLDLHTARFTWNIFFICNMKVVEN